MKKKEKYFDLAVWRTEYTDLEIVKFKGRDIWDAYRKACNEFAYVRRPYCSKPPNSKVIKSQINRRIRQSKDEAPMVHRFFNDIYICKNKGVVWFD